MENNKHNRRKTAQPEDLSQELKQAIYALNQTVLQLNTMLDNTYTKNTDEHNLEKQSANQKINQVLREKKEQKLLDEIEELIPKAKYILH